MYHGELCVAGFLRGCIELLGTGSSESTVKMRNWKARRASSVLRPRPVSGVALLARFAFAVAALACCAALDDASAQDQAPYQVTGFRDARFGMSEQDVRAAVAKDFGLKPADITSAVNPVEGTTVLTAKVASLDPGPGRAVVAYILGYASK